jgi:hypothetical protein
MSTRIDLFRHFAVATARKWGWPVFPVNGKRAFLPGAYKVATNDPVVVDQLWRDHPFSNLAGATGTYYWLLDKDPRHGGDAALAELEHQHSPLPDTVRLLTGGGNGGEHIYFAPDPRITNARGALPTGLDVRGFGGYGLLPPSVTDEPYRWVIGHDPDSCPIAVAPGWLLHLILQPTPHEADDGGPIGPGGRHEFLLRQCGKLAWIGLSEQAIQAELDHLNRTRCQPPLPGPGPDGWHRLLTTLFRYAKRGRAERRQQARQATADAGPADDQTGDTGSIAMGSDWPDPLPLDTLAVPPFPSDMLPPVLRSLVEDIVRVIQVQPDLPGVLVLGAVGSCCARRLDVAIGRTHLEPLNTYCAVVAESGERKGPALRSVLHPLYVVEAELRASMQPQLREARERRQLAERRLEALRQAAARAKIADERQAFEAEAIALAKTLPPQPIEPALLVSDRTMEKLEVELAQQDGALALASEEAGTVLAIAGGLYRNGEAQLDPLLKAYDRGEIDTARISREAVRCSTPELTILITPQPFLLEQLRRRPEFHHRGLLPRFLFAVPPPIAGHREYQAGVHPEPVCHAAYAALIRYLSGMLPRQPAGQDLPHLLITDAALERWGAYHDRVEHDLREGRRLEPIREWGSKQAARVARLAGILHVAAHRGFEPLAISVETMTAAITLGEYFERHALAAYDRMAALPTLEGARAILRWVKRSRRVEFSAREVQQKINWRFRTQAVVLPCLELLVEYGYLRSLPQPIGAIGRPPSPCYRVHPAVVAGRTPA